MNIDDLTLGEAKAIAAFFAQPSGAPRSVKHEGTKIVVLDRGFVYVGDVTIDGDFVLIHNARNIRVWGTTKGLGELCDGPTATTVVDDVGGVKAPLRAVIALIEAGGRWNSK